MGGIKIVSGTFRGRTITTPEGVVTRPLLTRLRKSLADILRPDLPGARVLELFGGSGAISFELLSNGAEHATIVELNADSARVIRQNARTLGADVAVEEGDCLKVIFALKRAGRRFDLAVVAPPYGLGLQAKAMEALRKARILSPGATAIVQRENSEPFWSPSGNFVHFSTRKYGRTVFDFYEWDEEEK